MKGQPAIGDFYRQEYFLGEAEDLAEVKSLTESVPVPGFSCTNNCLKTEETSPLAPGDVENKFYKQGVGLIRTTEPTGGAGGPGPGRGGPVKRVDRISVAAALPPLEARAAAFVAAPHRARYIPRRSPHGDLSAPPTYRGAPA